MALRIIAGDFRGRKLQSVGGLKTRPTASRTREAVFNILATVIAGSRVLDLFAGTGAFGIEALSRKAESAVFVDRNGKSIAVIQANIKLLGLENRTEVIRWDLLNNLNCLHSYHNVFDLVFMDPPYEQKMIEPTLENLHQTHALSMNAKIIIEHSRRETVVPGQLPFKVVDQRKYGKTLVTFLNYVL